MVDRITKKDRIVDELRSLISTGALARGERLQQGDIAARFDTSVTPVREALRQLEAEGLVVGEPHRGVRVTTTDLGEVTGIYIMRRLVEPYAFQRAARRMGLRELDICRRTISAMEDADAQDDLTRVATLNRDFHFRFYSHTGIPSLTRRIEDLWAAFPWDILQVLRPRVTESILEHRDILDSCAAEELDGLKVAVEFHLAQSHRALATHLLGHEPPDAFQLDVD